MDKYVMVAVVVIILAIGISTVNWIFMRRKYVVFTERICEAIDLILKGESTEGFAKDEDTLISKVQMKLSRLADITTAAVAQKDMQKQEVQSIVSDISHQLKTPISNINMYCDTVMQQQLSEEVRSQCMTVLGQQVKKLDFLTKSMLNMSRLEHNLITLQPERVCLKDTIFEAVSSIRTRAEQKGQSIHVKCPEEPELYYDAKWTVEALFNVVDNAVKYTPDGGKIKISVEPLELFTKVIVEDNGVGIAPEHINDVCKRFFREDKAHRTEGVGLGLYLTREIMMKQGGYVKIQSGNETGTKVTLYFSNQKDI